MGGFICKQPNGLYCLDSMIVDCITHYNMTEDEYIELCVEEARKKARDVLDYGIRPLKLVIENFAPNNMSSEKFKAILKEMESEITETTKMKTT